MRCLSPQPTSQRQRGFTVLELLLSVAIMTVIVIGLYTVFDQTQKALRGTVSQVDVLESVRAANDLLGRELEGAAHVPLAHYTNLFVARGMFFSKGVDLQGLSDKPVMTTVLQDVFFHNREGERWTAIGYWVGPRNTEETGPLLVGRLYRFSTNFAAPQITSMASQPAATDPGERNAMLSAFLSFPSRLGSSSPVIDGVVHLRVVAYGRDGQVLFGRDLIDSLRQFAQVRPGLSPDAYFSTIMEPPPVRSARYSFSSLSFPTSPTELEVELGVLEPQVLRQYESIAVAQPNAAAEFLARHSGQIHLFRQRFPIRNAPTL